MDIPHSLLAKHNRSGPRYTSYPTAPQFTDNIDLEAVRSIWTDANRSNAGLSLYTHFPFCRSRCLYCGCFTEVHHRLDTGRAYLSALKKEASKLLRDFASNRRVHQLALGGGTPTYLGHEQLADYINFLRSAVKFASDAELSVEVDPRSVDEHYLDSLVETGFNRFSFGVQDLDPKVQDIIQRPLEEQHLHKLLTHLRSRKREAFNLDLIYGLPGQNITSFSETVRKIAALRPSRIALFGYAHVPWVSPHQKALEKYSIPNPNERMSLFGTAFEVLIGAGYKHIGMDHFALPEDELFRALQSRTLTRNFMGYTTKKGLDLMGIGASSISSVGRTYVQNGKDILAYNKRKDGFHWEKGIILDEEDLLRREIILDLFCNFYLDQSAIENKWGVSFSRQFAQELHDLGPMADDGLISMGQHSLEVTPLGRFFIRNICMVFDKYIKSEYTEGRYSKTI
ncbi:MAG: oxygen-independent coproporphyrinogen III oxidase [bacterium]